MINLSSTVSSILCNDATLTGLLGGERVYLIRAPNADEYPRITFFELNNYGSNFADDTELESEIKYQIDVWHKGNPNPIALEVDRVMQENGFIRTYSTDIYEDDTNVFHKALRYRTQTEG
ncbi:tail completion protein gp17 [Alicyclobacillus fodiniaquatilis]|uniref:DUF3168 domain-containing protein n=1 Tax=Alicyclobacillus fodiniaquatilis TaxID=1661150 RepID=A0ABW4JI60_9BACL